MANLPSNILQLKVEKFESDDDRTATAQSLVVTPSAMESLRSLMVDEDEIYNMSTLKPHIQDICAGQNSKSEHERSKFEDRKLADPIMENNPDIILGDIASFTPCSVRASNFSDFKGSEGVGSASSSSSPSTPRPGQQFRVLHQPQSFHQTQQPYQSTTIADANMTDDSSPSDPLASPFLPFYTFDGPFEGKNPDLRIDPTTHAALAAKIEQEQAEMAITHGGNTSSEVSASQFLSSSPSSSVESIFDRLPDTFPPFQPAPTDLPIRLPSQEAQLAELDAIFNRKKHIKKTGAASKADERRNLELGKEYADWIDARTPYVKAASARLQAIIGERNDMEFELPDFSPQRSPLGDITSLMTDLDRSGPVMTPNLKRVFDTESPSTKHIKRSRNVTEIPDSTKNAADNPFHQEQYREDDPTGGLHKTLESLGGKVDKETGRGLREYLVKMGEEHGMTVQDCDSITFLDFTPEARFDRPKVKLMQHYKSGEGWQIEVREVDLPSTQTNPITGETMTSYERWIWFFISAPMVDTTSFEDPSETTMPPGDFPHPVPESWVVFALPLAHCTKYDIFTETAPTSDASFKFIEYREGMNLDPPSPVDPPEILCHRRDYDLSFAGLPIFEFSVKPPSSLAGWYKWSVCNNIFKKKSVMNPAFDGYWEGESGRFLGGSQVPDFGGGSDGWWATMFATTFRDVVCWEKIKRSMGRGKMRVVIRWKDDEKATVKGENEFEKALSAGVIGLGIDGAKLSTGIQRGRNLFTGMGGNRGGDSAPSNPPTLSTPFQENISHPPSTGLMPPPPRPTDPNALDAPCPGPDPGKWLHRPQGLGLSSSINAASFSVARSDEAGTSGNRRPLRRVQPFARPPGKDFGFGGPKPGF